MRTGGGNHAHPNGCRSYSHAQPTPVRSFRHDTGSGSGRNFCENDVRKAPKRRARHDLPGPAGAWFLRTRRKRHAAPTPASVPLAVEAKELGTGSLRREDLAKASPVRSGAAALTPSVERGVGKGGDRTGSAGASPTCEGDGDGGPGSRSPAATVGRGGGGGQLFHDHSGNLHDCNAWNLMCATIGRIAPRPDTTPLPRENPARAYRRMLRRSVPREYALIHEVRAGRYDTCRVGSGGYRDGDLRLPLLAGYVASVQCHAHSDWSALLVDEMHGVAAAGGGCDRRKGHGGGKTPMRGIMCCVDERLVKNHANWVRPGSVWLLQGVRLALFSEVADDACDYDSDVEDETKLSAYSSSVPSMGTDVSPSTETVRGVGRIDRMLMVAESTVVYAWTPEDAASSFTHKEYLNLNQRRSDLTFPEDVDEVVRCDGAEANPPDRSALPVSSQSQTVLTDVISNDALIEAPGQSPKKVTPQNTTSKNQMLARREATEKRIVSVEKSALEVNSDQSNATNKPMPPRNSATDGRQNDQSTNLQSLSYSNDKHSDRDDAFRSCKSKAGEEIISLPTDKDKSVPGGNKDDDLLGLLESTGKKSLPNGRAFTSDWLVGQEKENSPHSNPNNRQSDMRHQVTATLENKKETTLEKAELLRVSNKGPRQRIEASKTKADNVLDKQAGLIQSLGSRKSISQMKVSPDIVGTGCKSKAGEDTSTVLRSNPYATGKVSEHAEKSVSNRPRSDDLSNRAPPTNESHCGRSEASCTGAAGGSIPCTPSHQLDLRKEEINTVLQNSPQIQNKDYLDCSLETEKGIAAETANSDKVTHFPPKDDALPQQQMKFGMGNDDMLGEDEDGFGTSMNTQQNMKEINIVQSNHSFDNLLNKEKEITVETTASEKANHFSPKENTSQQLMTFGTGDSFEDMLGEDEDGFGTTINMQQNIKGNNTVQSNGSFDDNLVDKKTSEKVTHFSSKEDTFPQQQMKFGTGNSFDDMLGEDEDGFGITRNMQQSSCLHLGENTIVNSPSAGSEPITLTDKIMAPSTTRGPSLFDSIDADGIDLLGEDD